MNRVVLARASSLFLSLALLAAAGCCHHYHAQRPASLPPIENEAQKRDAVESQLLMARTSGWDSDEERAFSMHLITLPMKTRIAYQQRLARELTFGQIRMKKPKAPPENVPVCACGGNPCGVAAATPSPSPVESTPPATAVPARGERVK